MTIRQQAIEAAVAIGAEPPFVRGYRRATSEREVLVLIAADTALSEAKQDLDTSWAVDYPTLFHRNRWARYERTFALLLAGVRSERPIA